MRVVTLQESGDGAGQPLFIEFVNTLHWDDDVPIELIGNLADLNTWLAEHDLPSIDSDADLQALVDLRKHARAAAEALVAGQAPAATDLEALTDALAGATGHLVLLESVGGRSQLGFGVHDHASTIVPFRIALSFANFLESGLRERLKLCANPGCGFAFVDTSTNRTRRWCYMRYCGNRFKARAFRGRHSGQVT